MKISDSKNAKVIHVSQIITIYYFEFSNDYVFGGEAHDFWELVYVDKGELNVVAGDKKHYLCQGEMIFHKPNEFHSLSTANNTASNIIIMSFISHSTAMSFFEGKQFKVPKATNNRIANILKEANGIYMSLIDAGDKKNKPPVPEFGCEQLIYGHLEMFLIDMYRYFNERVHEICVQESDIDVISPAQSGLISGIIEFMQHNLDRNLQIQDITKEFYIGSTYLKVLFKQCTGDSVLCYFRKMKMKEAKRLIRECRYNFSEIAKMLGFSSVHYFSASFKRQFGMNPTEYINTIKLKEEIMKSSSRVKVQ